MITASVLSARLARLTLAAAALALAAGCSLPRNRPDPTRFYALPAAEPVVRAEGATLGLRRVVVPGYLQKPAPVVRVSAAEVRLLPNARWAEPLESGLARALRAALAAEAVVRDVQVYPVAAGALPDCEVTVKVVACEGDAAGGIRFVAEWSLARPAPNDTVIASGVYVAPAVNWDGSDAAALVEALGNAVAGLGREICAALPR